MYYKIENRECEVYQKLYAMRTKEIEMGQQNEEAIEAKIGLRYDDFLGYIGQQNLRRTTQYVGFKFIEPEKVDSKIWKESQKHPNFFVPNKRTKLGREMAEFLCNGLKGSRYDTPLSILGISQNKSPFIFPYIEIKGDLILIFLDDTCNPTDENVIEITHNQFRELFNKNPKNV